MKIHDLKPGQKKVARKRRGQGNATGNGTYGGRGMNGQNSRSGGGVRLGFEGGQTPLIQRMPKNPGFNNPNRVEAQIVNLDQLDEAYKDGETVSVETLLAKKLITGKNGKVKILGNGSLSKKLTAGEDIALSASAIAAFGGKAPAAKKEAAPKSEVKAVADKPVAKEEKKAAPKAAKKAPEKKAEGADDLTKIEGVGPKIAGLLADGGFPTFADVAKADVEALKSILSDAGSRYTMHDPTTWPQQSQLAADGKWDELKTLQDELDGGK